MPPTPCLRLACALALVLAPTPAAWAQAWEEVGDADGFLGLRPGLRPDWDRVQARLGPEAWREEDRGEGLGEWRFWFPEGQARKASELESSGPQRVRWGLKLRLHEGRLLELWVGRNPVATPRFGRFTLGSPVQAFRESVRLSTDRLGFDQGLEVASADGGPQLIADDGQSISGYRLRHQKAWTDCSRAFLGYWARRTGLPEAEAYDLSSAYVGLDPMLFRAQVLRLRSLGGEAAGRAEVAFALPPGFQHRAELPGGGQGPPSQVVVDEWVSLRTARLLKVGQMVTAEASLVSRDDQASRAFWVDGARLFAADDPASFPDLPHLPFQSRP